MGDVYDAMEKHGDEKNTIFTNHYVRTLKKV